MHGDIESYSCVAAGTLSVVPEHSAVTSSIHTVLAQLRANDQQQYKGLSTLPGHYGAFQQSVITDAVIICS